MPPLSALWTRAAKAAAVLGAVAGMTIAPIPQTTAATLPLRTTAATVPTIAAVFQYMVTYTNTGSVPIFDGDAIPSLAINDPAIQPQLAAPATSPSTVALPGLGFESAFQGSDGDLWFAGTGFPTADTHVPMAPGTSPATAYFDGSIQAVWQGTNGDLWITGPHGPIDLGVAMAAGTNPSITALKSGGYEVAVHGSNGDLWTAGTLTNGDTGQQMLAATSPGIAATSFITPRAAPTDDYYIVYASSANNWGQLVLDDGHTGGAETLFGNVASGTSPSIAILGL